MNGKESEWGGRREENRKEMQTDEGEAEGKTHKKKIGRGETEARAQTQWIEKGMDHSQGKGCTSCCFDPVFVSQIGVHLVSQRGRTHCWISGDLAVLLLWHFLQKTTLGWGGGMNPVFITHVRIGEQNRCLALCDEEWWEACFVFYFLFFAKQLICEPGAEFINFLSEGVAGLGSLTRSFMRPSHSF